MNSNPSFYPKHLAKQYVQQWKGSQKDHEFDHQRSLQQVPIVAPASVVTNFNGQSENNRSVTPVQQRVTGLFNESSPTFSSTSMTSSSPLDYSNGSTSSSSSRLIMNHTSNRKILEGLPDTFIAAMKQLFTLLDFENSGQVHIEGKRNLNTARLVRIRISKPNGCQVFGPIFSKSTISRVFKNRIGDFADFHPSETLDQKHFLDVTLLNKVEILDNK